MGAIIALTIIIPSYVGPNRQAGYLQRGVHLIDQLRCA